MKTTQKIAAGLWCLAAIVGTSVRPAHSDNPGDLVPHYLPAPSKQIELNTRLLNEVRDNDSKMEEIKRLLHQGADVDARDDRGDTALLNALRWGGPHIAAVLLDNKADIRAVDNAGWDALMLAANSGDVENVKLVLKRDPHVDVNFQDPPSGWTALILVSDRGNDGIVPLLLARGADVNLWNRQGETALMQTAKGSDASIVAALLDKKADINAVNGDGNTTLMLAAKAGNIAVVKALLQHRANSRLVNHSGKTALQLAADAKQGEVVHALTLVR